MFESLIRYYNHNRKRIITIIIVVIAVILLIQLLNQMAKKQLAERNKSNSTNTTQTNINSQNTLQTQTIISNTKINTETAQNNQETIKKFIEYCNNGEINLAYNMLSKKCQEELFNDVNSFKEKYYDKIFYIKRQYSIENWITSEIGQTYKTIYSNDALASGGITDSIEDYITITTQNNENKLSILRYIGNITINKSASNDIASIQVIDRKIYEDYEIYNIKVTNKTDKTIMLNRDYDNQGIYVNYQESDNKYLAYIDEIYSGDLQIKAGQTKYVSIKFNKIYNGAINTSKIIFSDIITDAEEYQSTANKNNYTNITSIEINL